MLTLTVNQALLALVFLVPFVIWLASRPINETIDLVNNEKDNNSDCKELNANYGAIIQSQGRYYN